jgi:Ca2+/H+ antiporter
VNPLFSRKQCERCGAAIVIDGKYKMYIALFVTALVLILLAVPNLLPGFLPSVSYFAKGLIAALLFVVVYAAGLYFIMKRATYHTYTPPTHLDMIEARGRNK